MSLKQGIDLALGRILKTPVEEQMTALPFLEGERGNISPTRFAPTWLLAPKQKRVRVEQPSILPLMEGEIGINQPKISPPIPAKVTSLFEGLRIPTKEGQELNIKQDQSVWVDNINIGTVDTNTGNVVLKSPEEIEKQLEPSFERLYPQVGAKELEAMQFRKLGKPPMTPLAILDLLAKAGKVGAATILAPFYKTETGIPAFKAFSLEKVLSEGDLREAYDEWKTIWGLKGATELLVQLPYFWSIPAGRPAQMALKQVALDKGLSATERLLGQIGRYGLLPIAAGEQALEKGVSLVGKGAKAIIPPTRRAVVELAEREAGGIKLPKGKVPPPPEGEIPKGVPPEKITPVTPEVTKGSDVILTDTASDLYKVPRGAKARVIDEYIAPNGNRSVQIKIEGEGLLDASGNRQKIAWVGDDLVQPAIPKAAEKEITGFHTTGGKGVFIQRGAGTYIALDEPFTVAGGKVMQAKTIINPQKVFDPNGVLEGTNVAKSKLDFEKFTQTMNQRIKRGTPMNTPQLRAELRTKVLKEMGYEGEAGFIDGVEGKVRELVVFDKAKVQLTKLSEVGGAVKPPVTPEVTRISPQKEAIIQKTVSDIIDKGFTTEVTSFGIDKNLEETVRGKYIGKAKAIVFRSEGDITPFLAEHELLHSVVAEAKISIGNDFLTRYAEVAGFTGKDLAKAIKAEYTVRTPIVEDFVRNMQVYLKHPNELSTPTKSFFDSFKAQLAIPKAEAGMPEAPVAPAGEFLSFEERGIRLGLPEEPWQPKTGVASGIEGAEKEIAELAQKVTGSSKPPPRSPITQARGASPPDDVNGSFTAILDNPDFSLAGRLPGEPISRVLVRQHEGAINQSGISLRLWIAETNQLLKKLPERKFFGVTKTSEAEQFIVDLAERASGGRERLISRSPQLLAYFDKLAQKLAEIEARDVSHSAIMERELSLIPDYFPDLWRDSSSFIKRLGTLAGKGKPGTKEFFEKQRVFATTREAIEAGKEFVTYDPSSLIALRDIAGIRRIQGDILFQKAKTAGMVISDIRGKVPEGWRQPVNIPAFNPKPIPHTAGEKAPLLTRGYAVPEEFARRLEDYFGTTGRSMNPLINASAWAAGQAKKIKVIGSLFQHLDFLKRGTASKIFVGGKPLEVPGMVLETLEAILIPSKRSSLLKEWTTDPFLKMVAEEGAGIIGGQSIARRNMLNLFEDIKKFPILGAIPERTPVLGVGIKLLNKASEYVNSGLFDGVYMAQAKHLAKDWGRMLQKLHPNWAERQVAAATADNISIALSSQATWQSVFRNQGTRQMMRGFLFSSAESEGLIRGFLRILPGTITQTEARTLWRRYWAGYFLTTIAIAEAINYAVTDEFLGYEQLSPVLLDKTGRPKYNWKFMRPVFGVTEQGLPMYLDLLGQMDTPLRWAIDPPTALKNRLSVPIRQSLDQIRNQQFTNRPITSAPDFLTRLKERFMYGLKEIATPITPGQIMREQLPIHAQAIQALGFGVTAPGLEELWKKELKAYQNIPSDTIEQIKIGGLTRGQYRTRKPEVDAKLFIVGDVSSVKTAGAARYVKELISKHKIDPLTISAVVSWQELQKKREEAGIKDTSITLTDRLIKELLKTSLESKPESELVAPTSRGGILDLIKKTP